MSRAKVSLDSCLKFIQEHRKITCCLVLTQYMWSTENITHQQTVPLQNCFPSPKILVNNWYFTVGSVLQNYNQASLMFLPKLVMNKVQRLRMEFSWEVSWMFLCLPMPFKSKKKNNMRKGTCLHSVVSLSVVHERHLTWVGSCAY